MLESNALGQHGLSVYDAIYWEHEIVGWPVRKLICALFPVAMDASERKESSLCIPKVSLSHSQERKEVRLWWVWDQALWAILCFLQPHCGKGGRNLFCIGEIKRGKGGIAPLDNTELGIRARLADPAAAQGQGLGGVRPMKDSGRTQATQPGMPTLHAFIWIVRRS